MARVGVESGGDARAPRLAFKGRIVRRALAASGLSLIVLSSTGAGITYFVSQPAVAAVLRDPASVLSQRSPGARGLALFRTKHKPPAFPVREHAEGPPPSPGPATVYTETGEDTPEVALGGPGLPGLPEIPGLSEAPPPPAFPLESGLPAPGPGEGGGGLVLIGGPSFGGPVLGGVPGPGGVGPIVDTPGAGIPEPSTWAMLILGFFGAGAALRRRRHDLADGVR